MEQVIILLPIVFFLILASVFLLGIGFLITGKSKLRTGMCGKVPGASKCEEKREGCSLCGGGKKDE